MKNNAMSVMYESSSEKELIKMWEDIKGGNVSGVNRSLMKAIAKNEEEKRGDFCDIHQEEPLYKKRMWDSSKSDWVPFSIWDAYTMLKNGSDLIVQIWRPLDIQPEYGPLLKRWHDIDTYYLKDYLNRIIEKEKEGNEFDTERFGKIGAGIRAFRKMVQSDQQELKYEGRYDELIERRTY